MPLTFGAPNTLHIASRFPLKLCIRVETLAEHIISNRLLHFELPVVHKCEIVSLALICIVYGIFEGPHKGSYTEE